jgi:hypothetical protein
MHYGVDRIIHSINQYSMSNHCIFKMSFACVYPLYITKAEKKGRTNAEVDEINFWMTGYDESSLQRILDKLVDVLAKWRSEILESVRCTKLRLWARWSLSNRQNGCTACL